MWLDIPPKFVRMHGRGHCDVSFRSCWSKDWTHLQVHRFQIKWKINEFVFYPLQCTYRRRLWQYATGNNLCAVQRWPERKIQQRWALWFMFQMYWYEHFCSNALTFFENGFPFWNNLLMGATFFFFFVVRMKDPNYQHSFEALTANWCLPD